MKSSRHSHRSRPRWGIGIAVLAVMLVVAVVSQRTRGPSADRANSAATPAAVPEETVTAASVPPEPAAATTPPPTIALHKFETYASFRLRPFEVAHKNERFQWTAEDGRDPEVIRALAHNDLEYERMIEENDRVFRRQLVYRTDTAAAVLQRARLTGEPVRQLAVPGLDGLEVEFEITLADLNPSGQQGMFAGHLIGRDNSVVTLAFKGGREAFTVISPADGLYLQGEPREPGELIVKSIDPDTYVVGMCGTP